MRKSVILFILLLLTIGIANSAPKAAVEKVTYRGWIDSYRITAGVYSIVVVPEIGGRVMEYSINGRNVLFESREEFGKTYPVTKEWHNYGGYMTWLAPQEAWVWPPDPMLDYGKANVEILQSPNGIPVLKITGSPSLASGMMFTKEISLDETGEVVLKQRMHNIGAKKVKYSLWSVTETKAPCFVAFPIKKKSKFENGLLYVVNESKNSRQFMVRKGICITNYLGELGKIGSDTDGPWMLWINDDLAYAKIIPPMVKGKNYPDGGCSVQVFTSQGKPGYVEMEVMGPITDLGPGEGTETVERWRIFQLSQPVTDENRVLKTIDGMRSKKWIP